MLEVLLCQAGTTATRPYRFSCSWHFARVPCLWDSQDLVRRCDLRSALVQTVPERDEPHTRHVGDTGASRCKAWLADTLHKAPSLLRPKNAEGLVEKECCEALCFRSFAAKPRKTMRPKEGSLGVQAADQRPSTSQTLSSIWQSFHSQPHHRFKNSRSLLRRSGASLQLMEQGKPRFAEDPVHCSGLKCKGVWISIPSQRAQEPTTKETSSIPKRP